MIVVFANKKGKYDFVILTSIDFAFAKVGGPILPYRKNLRLNNAAKLALIGHGSPGMIESYTADVIGDHLADPHLGVPRTLTKLIVTSCYAGLRPNESTVGTSVVEVLATKLRGHGLAGLEIVGYRGPSIKSAALGGHVRVVNDSKDPNLTQASALQSQALGPFEDKLGDMRTEFRSDMASRGSTARTASQAFYSKFVTDLEQAQILMQGDDVARVAVVLD